MAVVKATQFVRMPFVAQGFKVEEDNMEAIATWCQGNVVRENTPRPFVRVPVDRPTNQKQTQAFVGTWVLVSVFENTKTYKVYRPEWLERTFLRMDNWKIIMDWFQLVFRRMSTWDGDENDGVLEIEVLETPCCNHEKASQVPQQPKPGPFKQPSSNS